MTFPITNTETRTQFFNAQAPETTTSHVDNSLVTPQQSTDNAQPQNSTDKEKDALIERLSRSFESITKSYERLQLEIQEQGKKVQEQKQEKADLEVELAAEMRKRAAAEQDVQRYRQANVQPIAQAPLLEVVQASGGFAGCLESVCNGANAAGRFCHRNKNLFFGAFGLTGAICAGVFPEFAVPIVLGVGAAISLFKWVTSFFGENL